MRWLLVVAFGCSSGLHGGPSRNEAVARVGRKESFRAQMTTATFCSKCGRDAPVTLEFGTPAKVRVTIPTCYAHAKSKIGDHDNWQIAFVEGNVAATAGELDIVDCTSKHVTGTLWATFPDNRRVEAEIDTELKEP